MFFIYNRHSMCSSYLGSSWLVPESHNSMLAPSPQTIALKRDPGVKKIGPSARFIQWPYGKPGATLLLLLLQFLLRFTKLTKWRAHPHLDLGWTIGPVAPIPLVVCSFCTLTAPGVICLPCTSPQHETQRLSTPSAINANQSEC